MSNEDVRRASSAKLQAARDTVRPLLGRASETKVTVRDIPAVDAEKQAEHQRVMALLREFVGK